MPSIGIGIGLWRSNGGANAPPTIAITSPAGGATVYEGKALTITGTCADADGTIASVEVFAGVTSLGAATLVGDGTWTLAWTPSAAQALAGSASLTAVATDNGGLTTTSAAVAVTVANKYARVIAAAAWELLCAGDTVIVDSGNGEAGDQISQWTGRVSGRHLTQSITQDDQPTWELPVGGDPTALFVGGDGTAGDKLSIPAAAVSAMSSATKACVAVVLKPTSLLGSQYVYHLDVNEFNMYISGSGGRTRFYYGSASLYAYIDVLPTDSYSFIWLEFDGTQTDADVPTQNAKRLRVWLNGAERTLTFNGNVPASLTGFTTGLLGASGTYPYFGRISCFGMAAAIPSSPTVRAEAHAAISTALLEVT